MTEELAKYFMGSLMALAASALAAFIWLLKAQHRMISNHMKHDLEATKRNTESNDRLAASMDSMKATNLEITRTFTESLRETQRNCVWRRPPDGDTTTGCRL